MELIIIAILAALLPICTITAFVIGFNCNAPKKILHHSKKAKPTADEIMLERIDKATVFNNEPQAVLSDKSECKPPRDEVMIERINKATI